MYRIMIVEDDRAITGVLERKLGIWGYLAQPVMDFDAVDTQFEQFQPHLVLMDNSLPFYSGYHWCSELRKRSRVPILFLSSASDDMNLPGSDL